LANSKGMGRTIYSVCSQEERLEEKSTLRSPKKSVPSNSENVPSETNGQEAIFCESTCNSWLHRQCAGLFLAGPFYCPLCHLITQDSELQELKTSVDHLTKELTSLKATIAVIELRFAFF